MPCPNTIITGLAAGSMGSPFGSSEDTESPRRSKHITNWPSGLPDYPLLDEDDYSARQYEATISNLPDAAWKLKGEFELPEGWESAVYDWFADNDCTGHRGHRRPWWLPR